MKGASEMKVHELKIAPEYFGPVFDGIKTFEIRKNDRGYEIGDLMHLKEFDGEAFTGKSVIMEITYTTTYNQEPGYLVFAIKDPDFKVLNDVFGYNKAACLTMGCEPTWVLEQATDEDLEANISAVDTVDVF